MPPLNRLSSVKLIIAALLTIFCLFHPGTARAQSRRTWCGTDEQTEWLTYRVQEIARVADSSGIASSAREKIGLATSTRVMPVRDEKICELATRTYYAGQPGPWPANGVAVVRFGDCYGVYGDLHAGEWTILLILNLQFELVARYLA